MQHFREPGRRARPRRRCPACKIARWAEPLRFTDKASGQQPPFHHDACGHDARGGTRHDRPHRPAHGCLSRAEWPRRTGGNDRGAAIPRRLVLARPACGADLQHEDRPVARVGISRRQSDHDNGNGNRDGLGRMAGVAVVARGLQRRGPGDGALAVVCDPHAGDVMVLYGGGRGEGKVRLRQCRRQSAEPADSGASAALCLAAPADAANQRLHLYFLQHPGVFRTRLARAQPRAPGRHLARRHHRAAAALRGCDSTAAIFLARSPAISTRS